MAWLRHPASFTTNPSCEGSCKSIWTRRRISSTRFDPGGNDPEKQGQLWQDLFSYPSDWWDNRLGKRSPRHPDFVHKKTREPLWVDDRNKPAWVNCRLGILDVSPESGCGSRGPHNSQYGIPYLAAEKIRNLCDKGQVDEALEVLSCMDQHGTSPTEEICSSLLKACTKRKALGQAKRVHAYLETHGLDSSRLLGESVVNAFVKCGGLKDALEVFQRLQDRTVFSWTAVISGYAMNGEGREALRMYKQMKEAGVEPNTYTFVTLLKACASISDLNEGKLIHAEILKYGCGSDVFVGTCLVDMYARCGDILAAQRVFDNLPQRNVVSWTAMLTAYAQLGQADMALQLFEQMREQGVSPDARTYVSALQACATLAVEDGDMSVAGQSRIVEALEKGKAIHIEAWQRDLKSDVILGNALVSMYGKCGSVSDAQNVFDELPNPTVVSWNSIIVAYAQQGDAEKGLQLYEQMQEEGMTPNDRTFVSVLQACSILADKEEAINVNGLWARVKSLGKGRVLHAHAQIKSHDTDVFVSNTLIGMYGKCGSIEDAERVFVMLPHRSLVSWNSMLAACSHQEEPEKTLLLYYQMLEEGVTPNDRTLVSILQANGVFAENDNFLTKPMCLEKGKEMHAEIWRKGYALNVVVENTLVSMYGKCGSLVDARNVFDGLHYPSVVSWNAMLTAYSQEDQADTALQLYEEMQEEGVSPNDRTFVSALQACGMAAERADSLGEGSVKVQFFRLGRALHAEAWRRGYEGDAFIGSALIVMYGKCGSIEDAQTLFDRIPQPSIVLWNALLSSYVEQGLGDKALQLYGQLQEDGLSPNDITIVCILQACSQTGSLDVCRAIHHKVVSDKPILGLHLGNTLIHAYGRCASIVDACNVFDALPQRDVISWNSLIAAYVRQGDAVASLQCYERMQLLGQPPNEVTFLSLLSACSHAGLVGQGMEYFESMTRDYCMSPQVEHYVCMVDLLSRAGYFSIVEGLLSTMPVQPDLSLWLCLLSACRNHGRIVLGRKAFDCAVALDPIHPSAYILMSNLYAVVGLWDSAKEIHEMRQMAGAWKKPGQSWIEHDQQVTTFVAGDLVHQQQEFLYNLVDGINSMLLNDVGSPIAEYTDGDYQWT